MVLFFTFDIFSFYFNFDNPVVSGEGISGRVRWFDEKDNLMQFVVVHFLAKRITLNNYLARIYVGFPT
jgi:hypothetical protein